MLNWRVLGVSQRLVGNSKKEKNSSQSPPGCYFFFLRLPVNVNVYLLKGFRGGRRQAALRRWHRRHHHHQHPLLSERPLPPSSTASFLEQTLTVSWTEPQSIPPRPPPQVPLPPAFWLPPLCAWMVRLVGQESTEQRRWWWRWWRRRSSSKLQLDSVAAKCVWVYFCSADRRRLVSLWLGSLSGTWKRINLAEVTLRAELSFWFRFTLAVPDLDFVFLSDFIWNLLNMKLLYFHFIVTVKVRLIQNYY